MLQTNRKRTGFVLAGLLAAAAALGGCAGAVVGGAAAVGGAAMQDRGLKGAATDNAIVLEINHYWFQEGKSTLFSNVSTQIYEGRVLLTGAVTSPDTRAEAVRLAWKASGVREIINDIEVTDEGGLKAYAKDVWAANELRSRLLFAKGINSVNFSVDVVNGTVYILGVYADAAEHDRVLAVARNMSNVKKVVSHAIARDDPRRFRTPPGEAGASS